MHRTTIQIVSRLLLAVLLFAQGAVSAYACPALTAAMDQTVAATSTAAMPADCGQMDSMPAMDVNSPNLCLAHCQAGQQSNGQVDAPAVPPVVASILVVDLPDPKGLASAGRAFAVDHITAAASPPHTILHCCFRI
ncbi:MAG: hypothetical protein ABIO63_09485 [Casimicrobiaceae bacterium]